MRKTVWTLGAAFFLAGLIIELGGMSLYFFGGMPFGVLESSMLPTTLMVIGVGLMLLGLSWSMVD